MPVVMHQYVDRCCLLAMTRDLATGVMEGLVPLHDELSVAPEAPWCLEKPEQNRNQVWDGVG